MFKYIFIFLFSILSFSSDQVYFPLDSGELLKLSKLKDELINFKLIKVVEESEVVIDEFEISETKLNQFLEEKVDIQTGYQTGSALYMAYSIPLNLILVYTLYAEINHEMPLSKVMFWVKNNYTKFKQRIIKLAKVDNLDKSCRKYLENLPEILWFGSAIIQNLVGVKLIFSLQGKKNEYRRLQKVINEISDSQYVLSKAVILKIKNNF